MADQERLKLLTQILRSKTVGCQKELVDKLQKRGFETTQSSISRDLKRIGAIKVHGVYQMPNIAPGDSPKVERLDVAMAGDHLTIIRTAAGDASRVALLIDGAQIPGVVGTVAGDDTIFVAVSGHKDQPRIHNHIFSLFQAQEA